MAGQFNDHQSQHLAALAANLAAIAVTGAEVNTLDGLPFDYTLTPAAGAANITNVTIQAKDANGVNVAHVVPLLVWLSDSAAGEGLTSTTASGNVEAGSSGGVVLSALTSKKALLVQTTAAGLFILKITDTDKHEYVVCVQSLNGELITTHTLEAADYGGA